MEYQITTRSAEETMNLGQRFVALCKPGSTFCLTGDLGAGKTTLVRGIAKALNIKSVVQSPTFNIMKVYFDGDRPLIHIDAYRLADVNTDIGLSYTLQYPHRQDICAAASPMKGRRYDNLGRGRGRSDTP